MGVCLLPLSAEERVIDAMESGGILKVNTDIHECKRLATGDQRLISISIKDTGSGIPKEELKKIWEPFHTDKQGGTGLGLAITQRIIEEHGGKISVESEVGKGTEFKIEILIK